MGQNSYTDDPDVQLMLKFQKGDKRAFEELMKKYFPRVMNFIFRYMGNREVAEELTQEVFIKVYKTAANYTPQSKLQTWLFTIAKNMSLNELRKYKYKIVSMDQQLETDNGQVTMQLQDDGQATPRDDVLQNEKNMVIRQAIAGLPENQRIAVLLRRYEQFTYDEIAQTMGVSSKAVKSLLNRAKENLRDKLKSLLD